MKSKYNYTALLVIGLVLLTAFIAGCDNKAKSNTNTANAAKNTVDPTETARQAYLSAPAGAQPPNMLGSPTATVTVEEFADYQCPTCAVQHPKMKEITGLYGSRIKFIYRDFPLTQIHKNAYDAAVAAEAAGMQGSDKFWAMQNQLFENQQTWANSTEARKIFEDYAQKIGLDLAKYKDDALGLPVKTRVDKDLDRARGAAITGTPTIFINGTKLTPEQTDVSAMKQLIDAELQKGGSANVPNQPTNQAVVSSNNAANSSK
ncbi:MAG: DsbA family protein [Acidobacteriota bacterium]|nr:DsbA family protein [Acidobacteriota bacterium]